MYIKDLVKVNIMTYIITNVLLYDYNLDHSLGKAILD